MHKYNCGKLFCALISTKANNLKAEEFGTCLALHGVHYKFLITYHPVKGHQISREEERSHQRERDCNRAKPQVSSRSSTPDMHRRPISQEFRSPTHVKSFSHDSAVARSGSPRLLNPRLQRRGSIASLSSFDDDQGSRPSSRGSLANC